MEFVTDFPKIFIKVEPSSLHNMIGCWQIDSEKLVLLHAFIFHFRVRKDIKLCMLCMFIYIYKKDKDFFTNCTHRSNLYKIPVIIWLVSAVCGQYRESNVAVEDKA